MPASSSVYLYITKYSIPNIQANVVVPPFGAVKVSGLEVRPSRVPRQGVMNSVGIVRLPDSRGGAVLGSLVNIPSPARRCSPSSERGADLNVV